MNQLNDNNLKGVNETLAANPVCLVDCTRLCVQDATHVVAGITYGSDTVFRFSQTFDKKSNQFRVGGSLGWAISMFKGTVRLVHCLYR
jgi:hypothetical protein